MQLVTRKQWGARAPKSPPTQLIRSQVHHVVFHYSASDADERAQHSQCAARVKNIQNFHMDTRDWNDIAYNLLVCKHGFVFQGRGAYQMGAATLGHNSNTVAVCFLGDDTKLKSDLTEDGRDALVDAARYIEDLYKRGMLFRGHRDFVSTQCPGNEIYNFIRSDAFVKRVRA